MSIRHSSPIFIYSTISLLYIVMLFDLNYTYTVKFFPIYIIQNYLLNNNLLYIVCNIYHSYKTAVPNFKVLNKINKMNDISGVGGLTAANH
jgi:hypothetical protein